MGIRNGRSRRVSGRGWVGVIPLSVIRWGVGRFWVISLGPYLKLIDIYYIHLCDLTHHSDSEGVGTLVEGLRVKGLLFEELGHLAVEESEEEEVD